MSVSTVFKKIYKHKNKTSGCRDKFFLYLDENKIIRINRSGDEAPTYITSIFDRALFEEALQKFPPRPENDFSYAEAFGYIGENCRQYRTEENSYAYCVVRDKFGTEAFASGLTITAVDMLQLAFKARDIVCEYCKKTGFTADFSDPKKIIIADKRSGNGYHRVRVFADLLRFRTVIERDEENIASLNAESLREYVENQLYLSGKRKIRNMELTLEELASEIAEGKIGRFELN